MMHVTPGQMRCNPPAKEQSLFLQLLNERWKIISAMGPYRKPYFAREKIDAAVRAHAEVNASDPFAARRMTHYLQQGYEVPSDVLKESNARLLARSCNKMLGVLA